MGSYTEQSYNSGASSKRTKINETNRYSSNSNPTTPHNGGDDKSPLVRSPYVEACKKKRKQVEKKTSSSSSIDDCGKMVTTNLKVVSYLDRLAKTREQWLKEKYDKCINFLKLRR